MNNTAMIPNPLMICYNEREGEGGRPSPGEELLLSPTQDFMDAYDDGDHVCTAFQEIFYFAHCFLTSFLTLLI